MDQAQERSLFRSPGYVRLVGAGTLSRVANEMAPVALVLLVLDRTGRPALAGATAAAFTLPSLIGGPPLGAWLDRAARRRRVLALEPLTGAAGLTALALVAGHAPDIFLPAIALGAGALLPLSSGGLTSVVQDLVIDPLLSRANALEAVSFNLAILLGPALAGALAGGVGVVAAVLVQATLKLSALPLLMGLGELARRPEVSRPPLRRAVGTAVRIMSRNAPLRATTAAGMLALGGRGLLVVAFPLFASERLGMGSDFGGYLWAAFAAGSVAGALGFAALDGRRLPERIVLLGTAGGGAVMLVWPLVTSPLLALAAVAAAGALYGPALPATFAVRQREAPAELRGQLFTTGASIKVGSFALGAALSGPTTVGLGSEGALLAAAGVQLAAAAAGTALLRARTPQIPSRL